ncbi:MAG: P-type conjugative transfer protein TrbJ [Candidatus Margulisbacteria bacterium]|nr:P-type conjugative transfer protein TrbJ [Candidatus Margulisiibacteriota bacterium]
MNSIFRILVAISIMAISVDHSFGMGMIPYEATEWTQIANNIELIDVAIKEAQQVANQIQVIKNMTDNTLSVPNQIWGNTMDQLMRLNQVVQDGHALAYSMSNIDEVFASRYLGYKKYQQLQLNDDGYVTQYQVWSRTNQDTIRASLKAANLQSQQFNDEEETLNQLEQMSESSHGRLQAIQVGNQIATQQVRQTQKLRQLMMSQMQMQGAYLATQTDMQDAENARNSSEISRTIVGNEERIGGIE